MPNRRLRRTLALLLSGLLCLQAAPGLAAQPAALGTSVELTAAGRLRRARDQRPVRAQPARLGRQSAQPYREGEVLVTYKNGPAAMALASASRLGFQEKRRAPRGRTAVLTGRPGQSVKEMVAQLTASGIVEHAQPNYIYERAAFPDDPDWGNLWGLENTGQVIQGVRGTAGIDIAARPAWDLLPADLDEVVVAVIDEGVDINHPDLADKLWTNPGEIPGNNLDDDGNGYVDDIHGWDFFHDDKSVYDWEDGDHHGTHVAGTIAAAANTVGVRGVAPNVKIMPLKFLGPSGGTTEDAIAAINYAAANGAKVINASWGMYGDTPDLLLKSAIEAHDLLFVAAAGNDNGLNIDQTLVQPAGLDSPNIIAVAAVTNLGELASFSNWGPTSVDVGAPGQDIYSLAPGWRPDAPAAVFKSTAAFQAITLPFGPERFAQPDLNVLVGRLKSYLYPSGGNPAVLLVDDSYGAPAGAVQRYQSALAQAGFTNVTVHTNVSEESIPTAAQLRQYDLVLWFTGLDLGSPTTTTLSQTERDHLTSYLAGGRKLILAGEDALYGIEEDPFVTSTLGATIDSEDGNFRAVRGVPDVVDFRAAFVEGTDAYHYNDIILPNGAGALTGLYYTEPDYGGAYQYMSGTSMATPHVAGIGAVLLAQKHLTPIEAIALMKASGTALPALAEKTSTGRMVNLNRGVATRVSDPVVALSDPRPGEGSGYTVSFSAGLYSRLEAGSTQIRISFPAETQLPDAIAAGQIIVNGVPAGAAAVAGGTLVIPVPVQIDPGAAVSVEITAAAGLRNPEVAGAYQLSLSTSADPVAQATQPYMVTATRIDLEQPAYTGLGAELGERRKALVTVTSPTGNADPVARDTVQVTVTTGSDPAGLTLDAVETGPDTGIFTGRFGFTDGATTAGPTALVQVANGETVTVTVDEQVSDTATWTAAGARRLVILGEVNLRGYLPGELAVAITDSAGTPVGPSTPVSNPFRSPDLADGEVYSVVATATHESITGQASISDVAVGYAAPGAEIVTVAENGTAVDEYRFGLPTLVLSPSAPGFDQAPPQLLATSPQDGATNALYQTPIRLHFDERIQLVSPDPITLTKGGGGTVPATIAITGETLTLSGFTLEPGALYTLTVPAGTLADDAPTPNVLQSPITLTFTTLSAGLTTADSWPQCGGGTSVNCVADFTLNGAAPDPRYKLKVTGPTGGRVQVQLLDLSAADPAEVYGAGEIQLRLDLDGATTPAVLYGLGQPVQSGWSWDGAQRQVIIRGRPQAAAWNRTLGCGPGSCPMQADTLYQGVFILTLDTLPSALQGAALLGRGQYVSRPVYDAQTQAILFNLGSPHLQPNGMADTRTATIYLPDAVIAELWNLDAQRLTAAAVTVKAGPEDPTVVLTRLGGGWSFAVSRIPAEYTELMLAPRTISLVFDNAIYVGTGAEDVGWDDTSLLLRRKVLVTMTDNGSFNQSPTVADQATALIKAGPDGTGILITLTEDGPDTGIFTGTFGFTAAADPDTERGLINVAAATSIQVAVVASPTDLAPLATAEVVWMPANQVELRVTGELAHPGQGFVSIALHRVASGSPTTADRTTVAVGRSRYTVDLPTAAAGAYRVGAGAFNRAAWSEAFTIDTESAEVITTAEPDGQIHDRYVHEVPLLTLAADTAAPAAPVLLQPVTGGGGRLLLQGAAEPFAELQVTLDGEYLTTVWVNGAGRFALHLAGLQPGLRTVELVLLDNALNLAPPIILNMPLR